MQKEGSDAPTEDLSAEAEKVLAAVVILERENVHLDQPHIRKELIELIKNYVR